MWQLRREDAAPAAAVDLPNAFGETLRRVASSHDLGQAIDFVLRAKRFRWLTCVLSQHGVGGSYSENSEIVWSSLPPAWTKHYCHARYQNLDPRLAQTRHRFTPVLWDAATMGGDWRIAQFLAAAARFGVKSGVAVSVDDRTLGRLTFMFDSDVTPVDPARKKFVLDTLGDLMLMASAIHEVVLSPRLKARQAELAVASPLTHRELHCISLAARGMTSGDIGAKLGITKRGVNFHMANIVRKLCVLNRHEAIAKGVARGIIRIEF